MENEVFQLKLNRETSTKALNDWVLHQIKLGNYTIDINCADSKAYSNVCAPVAAVLEYYRKNGVKFNITYSDNGFESYVKQSFFECPQIVEREENKTELMHPFNKVWKFSTEQGVYDLASAFVFTLRKTAPVAKGIIQGIDWCINETMDNVFVHSGGSSGYAMAQYFPTNGHFAFCVFDTGIGILNSFHQKNSKHNPANGLDAITLALQEKVTSDETTGQGNGMWGLSQIVKENNGSFTVCSSGAKYQYRFGQEKVTQHGEFNLGPIHGTTYIEFQVDCSKQIDIAKALNYYLPMDFWEDQHTDDFDRIVIKIAEESSGTGTRIAGNQMRTLAMNLLREQHNIAIDFLGVNFISSSYADELIGKLVAEIGFVQFCKRVSIENIAAFNVPIINRSVGQRMAQLYYDSSIPDSADE